jgi:hypothetical protein
LRFTVRRPPTGEVSPCGHRPPGGDVACSVDVGVAPWRIASFALENRLALAVLRRDVPTRGTTLRRIRSRDLLDPAEGLVLQAPYKLAPASSADCAVEPAFLGDVRTRFRGGSASGSGHRAHVKSLDSEHVETQREVGGGFLDPILTPIRLTGFQFRDRPFHLFAAAGAPSTTREPLLQHLQPLGLSRGQTGCVQQFAGGQRRRYHNSAVDADHAAITRTCDRPGDVGERNMPAAGPIAGYPVGLHTGWHPPRHAKPYPANLWHPHPTKSAVQHLDLTRFQPDLPKPFMYTGFTPCRAAVRAVEEVLHRLFEITQRLLLHRLTSRTKPPVLGASFCQLRSLLQIAGSPTARLPMAPLLNRQVPYVTRVATMRQQSLLLLRGWQQSEPRHNRTVTTDTDIPGPRTPSCSETDSVPAMKSGVSNRRRLT